MVRERGERDEHGGRGAAREGWRKCALCLERSLPPGKIRCEACHHVHSSSATILEGTRAGAGAHGVVSLADVTSESVPRYRIGILDLLFGSEEKPGIACTSVNVFAAEPGFGKTTVSLQAMSAIARSTGRRPLFVGAEQSSDEVKEYARRLRLDLAPLLILTLEAQNDGAQITPELLAHYDPPLVVIDSQQAYSDDQDDAVDLVTGLKGIAVARKCAFVVICQMTKKGAPEGSNRGLHAGDCVMMGEKLDVIVDDDGKEHFPRKLPDGRVEPFRAIRTEKNRFAPSNEVYFEMTDLGLVPWRAPKKRKG